MKYVMQHGRRIAVETIETNTSPPRKRKPFKAQWVKVPLQWVEIFAAIQERAHISTSFGDPV